ncbi:hypothetical protein SAMN05428961_102240 [Paenibacillus sp. OK060]|nr:hypothetical protein SAMN05428961_102240 [Paenibacillus sp. OK060]SLJ88681.1 hypothetical protein SAMN06272722_101221 [Paenibacillus sp. RU5A]SOC62246.1 hypothetical protein SAMN05880581_101970 [Paenibacillus sp. RU26A]SOC68473.1 hypothetical protein SAMN05880586_101969 [Paenibacillus sp. RU5M]
MVYIILAVIIWIGAYAALKSSNQPIEVKPIRSINDLFE